MGFQQVILTQPVDNLGAEADIVKVRRGFARNFLIPRGKALEVTPGALRRVNFLKARRAEREAQELTHAEELGSKIRKLKLTFTLETGETGKAFGAITAKDVQDRIQSELQGVDLPRHAVTLDEAIKSSGEHQVSVKLHPQVTVSLAIKVAAGDESGEADKTSSRKAPKKE